MVAGAIVVDFKDGTTKAEFDAWEADWGVDLELNSVESADEALTVAVGVDDVDGVLERIRRHPAVEAAEPMMEVRASFTPNDPHFAQQWNLRMIDMPKAWERNRGKGVVVAVLDTGIAYEDHGDFKQAPDLKGVKFVKGFDFVNDDEHANDDHGHGTHVAGTIAQATNNGEGVAGVAFEATLMPVKVLNHFGGGNTADIADAIRFAADKGADVINLSLGGGAYSQVMASAVEYARKKGVTVVAAAGNGGRATVEFPAAYPGAVAVSAVGPDGVLAPYSSYGKELDIAAPGGDKRRGDQGASSRTPSTRAMSRASSTRPTRAPAWPRRTSRRWRRCSTRPAPRDRTRWSRPSTRARRSLRTRRGASSTAMACSTPRRRSRRCAAAAWRSGRRCTGRWRCWRSCC